ncbi:hypothetical protein GGQ77_001265 [Geobacillus thermodenitrificans]|nr:hypothetical protein [Geobacillus thermodenitrificans]
MKKHAGRKKRQEQQTVTLADRVGADVEAKLLAKKRALAEEEQRRRAAEEARRRDEQKSFAELLEESELDWRKFK